jgi:hypothetical protein
MTQKEVESFIEDWCNLWPPFAEWNGYKLKSKPKDCLNKMVKFCKENPTYTKNIIFEATKNYLVEQYNKDWAFTKQATYFISKVGQPSLLESYCEKITHNVTVSTNEITFTEPIFSSNDFI